MDLKEAKNKLTLEIVDKINTLAIAAFGLVAALAWNDAITAIFKIYFPTPGEGVGARIIYAILVTVIVVAITLLLARWLNKVKAKVIGEDCK